MEKTTLQLHLNSGALTTVRIYDMQGKLVQTANTTFLAAGDHQLPLDRANLKAGIYYCRVSAGSIEQTIKMLIINP